MKLFNNLINIDSKGQVSLANIIASTPIGLYTYGGDYITGSGLLSTPAAIAIPLIEGIDVAGIWTVNTPSNGVIGYSGATRIVSIVVCMTAATNSGGVPSTISVAIQRQVGAGAWANIPGSEVDRYLSSTADTASMTVGGKITIASGDNLRLFISSTSDAPTYIFNHIAFLIGNAV